MALLAIEDLELGPAKYTFGGTTIASKSGATLSTSLADYSVEGELSGMVHRRRMHVKAEVSFTPDDQISTAIIAALYPFRTQVAGKSAFVGSGAGGVSTAATPLVIETMDAKKFTLTDAALVKMPDLNFAVNKGLFGSVTYRARPCYGTEPGVDADVLVKKEAGSAWTHPAFANGEFISGTPILAWNGTDIAGEADDGWTVQFNMKTQDVMAGGRLRDIRFMGYEVLVKGTPTDVTPDALITAAELNTDVLASGESTRTIAKALSLTMGTTPSLLTLSIPLAAPVSAGFRFGATTIRNGEIGFVSVRNFTGPVVFTLAVS
jgi:hypothetical protein